MAGGVRLKPTVWINPGSYSSIQWRRNVVSERIEMQVFHPDALEDLYFVVDEDCEMDVMTALGIERRRPRKSRADTPSAGRERRIKDQGGRMKRNGKNGKHVHADAPALLEAAARSASIQLEQIEELFRALKLGRRQTSRRQVLRWFVDHATYNPDSGRAECIYHARRRGQVDLGGSAVTPRSAPRWPTGGALKIVRTEAARRRAGENCRRAPGSTGVPSSAGAGGESATAVPSAAAPARHQRWPRGGRGPSRPPCLRWTRTGCRVPSRRASLRHRADYSGRRRNP